VSPTIVRAIASQTPGECWCAKWDEVGAVHEDLFLGNAFVREGAW
jgi:hypothetical protein